MAAKKLTAAEKAWMAKLEQVFFDCPSDRLSCYTVGDGDLTFYDKNIADAFERAHPTLALDASDLHTRAGSMLCKVQAPFQIDSCQSA